VRGIARAAISVGVSGLFIVAAYAGEAFLVAAVALAVAGVAAGWGRLLALPSPRGSNAVVAASGAAALALAGLPDGDAGPLAPLAGVLALSVLLAFAHELLRRDGRPRLVESVSGTFTGQAIVVFGTGWLFLPLTADRAGAVAVAGGAAIVARLATELPWPLRITGPLAVLLGASFGALLEVLALASAAGDGAVLGACVAVLLVALDRLLGHQPAATAGASLVAAECAPVLATGTAAYAVARVVLG
jgi:hypothetical protein